MGFCVFLIPLRICYFPCLEWVRKKADQQVLWTEGRKSCNYEYVIIWYVPMSLVSRQVGGICGPFSVTIYFAADPRRHSRTISIRSWSPLQGNNALKTATARSSSTTQTGSLYHEVSWSEDDTNIEKLAGGDKTRKKSHSSIIGNECRIQDLLI